MSDGAVKNSIISRPDLAAMDLPAPDGVPLPQRYWAILTIALGLILAVLNGAIANVALPTIARDMHTSPAGSIWVVNAFQLAVTVSLLPLASLGEIHGYKRIYKGGLILFTIASLFCALSSSLPTLIVARVIQGVGAAGIMSVNGALVRFIYPRAWLGRGVGLNATIGSTASAIGPSVASAILSVAHWPWLFAVNVPLGILAIIIAWHHLPDTPRTRGKFDVISALLQAAAFGLLLIGISEMGHGDAPILSGWKSPPAWASARSWWCASSPDPRRCCRSTCCASRCSRCRWRAPSAPSSRKA